MSDDYGYVKFVPIYSRYKKPEFVEFTSSKQNCQHYYSFRVRVKFWIFSKIIEVCPECREIIK